MKQNGNTSVSRDQALREMQVWQENKCSMLGEYDTLWAMFRAVVTSGSWGTSEYGGPVWLMDFSLANLQKLFPDNPWLEAMQNEWAQGKMEYGDVAKSEQLRKFSEWFEYRAGHMIQKLGLGNVLVKSEGSYDGNLSFYGQGIFLDILQSLIGGRVERVHHESMLKFNFSYAEMDTVMHGNFLTCLKSRTMVKKFPGGYGSGFHYYKDDHVHGKCYKLEHFSLIDGYVIPETSQEKFLILVVNDLMECKAQGYGNKADKDGYTVPYPQMKYEQFLDLFRGCGSHFRPTSDVFHWWSKDGIIAEIKPELPQIDAKYGEFWHRQFPPKQNWRALK